MANIERTDKFGNHVKLVPCYDKKGKGWYVGYLEVGNKVIRLEINPTAQGQGTRGDARVWISARQAQGRTQQRNSFGPQQGPNPRGGF